jgi:DNA-binding transcriptional regulator YdaS (Cro superfamily)
MSNIKQIVKHFGYQAKLAKALNVTRMAVNQWVKDDKIPPAQAIKIEILTNGKFKAIDLVKK